jgi:Trypsin-like peptidase domain/Tetratricopeptide Repeats-Sensor
MSAAAIVENGRALAKALRDARQFSLLTTVAEALTKGGYDDPTIVLLHAQGLIDSGQADKAVHMLTALADKLPRDAFEFGEATGLIGRAWKQIFFDAQDKADVNARAALAQAFAKYRFGYETPPGINTWLGLNVLALAAYARREGITLDGPIDERTLALKLLAQLDATPPQQRDNWYHASRAEAYLGFGDLEAVEMHIGAYVRSEATNAFELAGTLRQFTDLWQLDRQGEQGRGIVQALRAGLLGLKSSGRLELPSDQVRQTLVETKPSDAQLQKILGNGGVKTYEWMLKGLTSARSVGVIRAEGRRIGTGFLVRGGDFTPALGDDRIVVTNAHVISDPRCCEKAVSHQDASITFEAVDTTRRYSFEGILWQHCDLDCTLLRLEAVPNGIEPLVIARDPLPTIPKGDGPATRRVRVYVIGYPGGRDLAFSLQDNELLDHEGPPDGHPPNPVVCRVQYRAPTEPGSSGSPVFNASYWRVIALHHAGAEAMGRLNEVAGKWPANEGVWIQSIVAAVRASAAFA